MNFLEISISSREFNLDAHTFPIDHLLNFQVLNHGNPTLYTINLNRSAFCKFFDPDLLIPDVILFHLALDTKFRYFP